ncbi:hypothetical protein F4819DRAFT_450807 [Hypoxylon fuscum]|nr:hypothetical protein F4819DRAFT_450807 [Hypoxylon fuscum]
MPPKASTAARLTPRDMEILCKAWECLEGVPKINFEKLANAAGFKNTNTARVCFSSVKAKLIANAGTKPAEDDAKEGISTKDRGKRKAGTGDTKTPRSAKRKAKSSSSAVSSPDDDRKDSIPFKLESKDKLEVKVKEEEEKDDGVHVGGTGEASHTHVDGPRFERSVVNHVSDQEVQDDDNMSDWAAMDDHSDSDYVNYENNDEV